jgi:hypothetical protein
MEILAAAILGLSTRQLRRLIVTYRDGGGGAMIHKARGTLTGSAISCAIANNVTLTSS